MPRPLLIFSQSDYLIQIFVINLHTSWQTVQIQISWLLQKPTDLDLHCLQNRIYPGSAGHGLMSLRSPVYRHQSSLMFFIIQCKLKIRISILNNKTFLLYLFQMNTFQEKTIMVRKPALELFNLIDNLNLNHPPLRIVLCILYLIVD